MLTPTSGFNLVSSQDRESRTLEEILFNISITTATPYFSLSVNL
jgi:hypothetical protein